MKKVLLSIAAMITFGFAANAQVSLIPKAGVTLSNIIFDEEEEGQKFKLGFVGGVGFNFPVSKDGFISIQPELLYIQKGAFSEHNAPIVGTAPFVGTAPIAAPLIGSVKITTIINYLELPVLAKISFGSDAVKAYVNAGPSLGFGLGGKYKLEAGNEEAEGDLKFGDEDDDKLDNRFDLGAQFGCGVGFKAGPGSLLLDVRYGLSFSNLIKAEDGITAEEAKSKHRVFALSLGYAIALGN